MRRIIPAWLTWSAYTLWVLLAFWMAADIWRIAESKLDAGAAGWEIALRAVRVSIPMGSLLFVLWLIFTVLIEEAAGGVMSRSTSRLLYWTPRAGALLFAGFLCLFALDFFEDGPPPHEILGALFILLMPWIGRIVIGWRHEWVGAAFFIGWALFVGTTRGFDLTAYITVVGLPVGIGVLFLLNWHYRAELHHTIPPGTGLFSM